MRIVYTRQATADVREAARFYEQQQEGLAYRFTGSLQAVLEQISLFPHQFQGFGKGVHRAPFPKPFKYSVYYYPVRERNRLLVVGVLHDARDPDFITRRL